MDGPARGVEPKSGPRSADSGGVADEGADARRARTVHGLRIEIDENLCVGFGDCIAEAPDAFDLDGSAVAFFTNPESVERQRLLDACAACPVDAITVTDESGERIVP